MTAETDLKEIDAWIASLGTPESDARDFIATARARGAKIKKGRPTEKVLLELLEPLMRRLRENANPKGANGAQASDQTARTR